MSLADLTTMVLSRLNPTPFVLGWIETRPWRLLVAAIPVLAGVAIAVALRASMNVANGEVQLRHYLSSAAELLKKGDEAGAELRFRRAALIAPADPRPKYGLALIAEDRGDSRKAKLMMEALAAEHSDVAIQANRWLIGKTALDKQLDTEGRRVLIARLEKAVEAEPQNTDWRLMLAEHYRQAGFPKNAVPHVSAVAQSLPKYRISVVQLLMAAGEMEAAREEAAAAERFFAERLTKEPGDFESRMLRATALSLQKKHSEAIQVLEDGAGLSDPVAIRKALSMLSVSWAAELRREQPDSRQILPLISAALRADPSNTSALLLLTDLAGDTSSGEDAVSMLKESLAAGEAPWLIHMALGTRLLGLGSLKEGAEHLEQAVKLNPSAAVALNNLAWTLASKEPPELERAEALAAQAVALSPANPQILETRGQIYLKQGRWKDARSDLEAVLPIYAQQPQLRKQLPHLHNSLAKAYHELGNADMARLHRERARGDGAKAPAGPPAPTN